MGKDEPSFTDRKIANWHLSESVWRIRKTLKVGLPSNPSYTTFFCLYFYFPQLLLLYRHAGLVLFQFCMLMLCPASLLTYFVIVNCFKWSPCDVSLCKRPCHLQVVAIWLPPFQWKCFLSFVWLLQLTLSVLWWVCEVNVDIFVSFLDFEDRLLAFFICPYVSS